MNSKLLGLLLVCVGFLTMNNLMAQHIKVLRHGNYVFEVPEEYLEERENIPRFWKSTNEEVANFLHATVKKGTIEVIGVSAGGRPILAATYGTPRKWKGTTTFSGSLGARNDEAYRGPDHQKTVYLGMAGVHGGEFEGIVGIVNLISVIETGKDLRGTRWPEISNMVEQVDRLILIPIVNPDGRERVPIRMQKYRGNDLLAHEFLNTGGNPDGTLIGWLEGKEQIPFDFKRPGFPGGYPNDAGVNIMHDDFLGSVQPETQALLDLVEREKPDLTVNMHTGAAYVFLLRPFTEQKLQPVFDSIYTQIHSRLTKEGLQRTKDVTKEANPEREKMGVFNLDGALNLHCGTLCITIESPSHGFDRNTVEKQFMHTPEMLLDAQLYCHIEALRFLKDSGGRSKW